MGTNLIAIFLGGGIGAILRFCATILSSKFFATPIYGTFAVNIVGCFLIGSLFGLVCNKTEALPLAIKLFLTTGLLGGLTTFSTLNFEVFELIKSGKILIGLGYLFLSCFIGLICTYFGYSLFSKI